MFLRKVREAGGTPVVSLPRKWLSTLGLDVGDFVSVGLGEGFIVVTPAIRKDGERWNGESAQVLCQVLNAATRAESGRG